MNVLGFFTVIVLLFVIYNFLKMVYDMTDRKFREGYKNNKLNPFDEINNIYN